MLKVGKLYRAKYELLVRSTNPSSLTKQTDYWIVPPGLFLVVGVEKGFIEIMSGEKKCWISHFHDENEDFEYYEEIVEGEYDDFY